MQGIILQVLTMEEFYHELKINIEHLHSRKVVSNVQTAPAAPTLAMNSPQQPQQTHKRNVYFHASALISFGDDVKSYYILRVTKFCGTTWEADSKTDETDGLKQAIKIRDELRRFCDSNKLQFGSGFWRFPNEEI